MRTTRIVIILLGIFAHLPLNAQYSLKCDPVIYPICPGSDDGNASGNLLNNAFKSALICDTAYVIQDAVFGTVEYVGSGGNVGEDSLYNYTTNTNCEPIDSFLAVECCADSTGSIVCDTVQHMMELSFMCETPDDLFCCIPNNGTPFAFEEEDLLENDSVFIQENYPQFIPSEVFVISIVMFPDSGTLTSGPNDEALYTPNPGFIGVDSIIYEVQYYLENGPETVTICDEQTAYFIVEDCIQTVPDELTVAPGDTVYFNALANDYIEPDIEPPYMGVPDCQNPLPQIDSSSFTLLTSGGELNALGDGELCFSSPTDGCFSYEYEVCSTVGVCATDTIIVKVTTDAECENINGNFEDFTGVWNGTNAWINDSLTNWFASHGTPSYFSNPTIIATGSGMWMWSYNNVGEGVYTEYNFVVGNNYTLTYDLYKFDDSNPASTFRVELASTFTPGTHPSGGSPIPNPAGTQLISNQTWSTNGAWETITETFTANTTHTQAWFYPLLTGAPNPNQAAAVIDNVCIVNNGPVCIPVIDLGTVTLLSGTVHAQNQVISSGNVPTGANVSLKAGQCIRLDAGFQSDANTDLEIIIEDCTPQ